MTIIFSETYEEYRQRWIADLMKPVRLQPGDRVNIPFGQVSEWRGFIIHETKPIGNRHERRKSATLRR